jgi:predicted aspartyl protease
MGNLHVSAHLTGPTGITESVDLLVDTGATFLAVPRAVADRLGLEPARIVSIQVAGGTKARWPLADVRLSLGDDEVVTPCLIVPEGTALLGAVALETLLLAVDLVAKRLVPTDGYAMRSAARHANAVPA